ncbi:D-alanyl-D-alanine carboxypeptidase family protein [Magnetovibrio sp.]|uniref:D-alanyl-D-alanine carboxypeptidase family protein n=1 Tax=Magnetovibrio sp. TaxID=2024836 RepID=UPI002F9578CF
MPRSSAAFALAALVLLLATLFSPTLAHAKYASLVIDAKTGEVLHEINADTRNYPASLTKMMTLYMVFEALEDGRLRMDDRIMMSRRAANQPPSKLGLKPGQTLSVEDAIRALAIKSANDVAAAVSEHLAGTERQFALLMTAKARTLGMTSTTFRNASGLPHRAQMSTARDMSKLARALLMHFPHRYHYFSESAFEYSGKTYKTHNQLLTNYEGTDGIKTGYIRASGFNLVASVKRGEKRLIGVVFGAKNSTTRNNHMVKLLDKGWSKVDPQMAVAQAQGKTELKTAANTPAKSPNRPSTTTTDSSAKAVWGVQIGAYKAYDPAYEIAVKAVSLAPSYLADGDITVAPLEKKNGRVLYRGRVMGISKTQAYRACKFLKQKKYGCMPLKTTEHLEVASLN